MLQAINDKFGIPADQIRAYVHYHPSYSHFPVHFVHLKMDAGAGMAVGKAHLLDDIIGESGHTQCTEILFSGHGVP